MNIGFRTIKGVFTLFISVGLYLKTLRVKVESFFIGNYKKSSIICVLLQCQNMIFIYFPDITNLKIFWFFMFSVHTFSCIFNKQERIRIHCVPSVSLTEDNFHFKTSWRDFQFNQEDHFKLFFCLQFTFLVIVAL